LRANDQLEANALRSSTLGEIDALVIVRDATADHVHLRHFKLAQKSVLIGHAGPHGIDYVHADDHLLRLGSYGR
jgi:hypothetical protein